MLDRDRSIAEIIPVRVSGGTGPDEERLAALERAGFDRGPQSRLPRELLEISPPGTGADVLAALLEERESSR